MGIWKKNISFDTEKNIVIKKLPFIETGDNRLPGIEMFYNELNILQTLKANFINKPTISHYPFPEVLSYNKTPNNNNEILFSMTHCGISAWDYFHLNRSERNIKPKNYLNTVECIINNLKINRIYYREFKADNICIKENGEFYLIDFGRFTIWKNTKDAVSYYEKPNLNILKASLYNYVGCSESDFLIEKAFEKDNTNRYKWKNLIFKHSPWSMLYYFK